MVWSYIDFGRRRENEAGEFSIGFAVNDFPRQNNFHASFIDFQAGRV